MNESAPEKVKHIHHGKLISIYVRNCEKPYLLTCAPNEDSNQPAHPRSLIRVFVVRIKKKNHWLSQMYPVKIRIRLRDCAG